ncbi:hypothetical protein [Hyphomicrobium sp.]|uniref:hypothetical protein n=1 Tax=Hyphomicrobium sp. TaxID=82 RepID=UPI0025BCFB08|nr:hypothetical protein [Hyphomicrobium sp.]MCC7252981.1 hypothetical protein [Hyphomicrobium sp.]
MRGVGVRGSLLAGVSTVAILFSVQGPVAAELAAASPAETSPTAAPARDDYYTRRARSILDAEKAAAAKPHPLAASYPGMDIVVCEAGCPDRRGAHVVFARRHVVATESREGMMVPTSGEDRTFAASASAGIACVAGCYGGTTVKHSVSAGRRPIPVERMAAPPRDVLSPVR